MDFFYIWELRTSRYDKNTLPRCGNIFHTRQTSFWELFSRRFFDTFQDVNLFRSWQSLSHYFLANSTYFASLPNRFELPNTLKYGIGVAIASQGQILSPKHWPLLAHPQPGGRRATGSGGFGGAKTPAPPWKGLNKKNRKVWSSKAEIFWASLFLRREREKMGPCFLHLLWMATFTSCLWVLYVEDPWRHDVHKCVN